MKILKGSLAVLVLDLILFFPSAATPLSTELREISSAWIISEMPDLLPVGDADYHTESEWRRYDINADGKFDEVDIDELINRGWHDFDYDLNNDGAKDGDDVLSLFLRLSILDRSCDGAVDDEDFLPVEPVSLPGVPDREDVRQLVSQCIFEASINLPVDIEMQVLNSVPGNGLMTIAEKAYAFQVTGMSSLMQKNLDGAKWAFARAFQTNNQSASALGSLAFVLATQNREVDALLLLTYARDLFPESAATSTSIGWIYGRHGQNEQALEYYREAVFYAPEIGQYHMNLGIVLMRLGMKREAWKAFSEAIEKDPGDAKKVLFWYTTKPPEEPPKKKPVDPEEFKKEIERQAREMEEQGATEDELPTPWGELSPCNQACMIPEILERKYDEQMREIAQAYSNDLAKKIENVIKGYWPQWTNFTDDWARFKEGVPVVYKTEMRLKVNAEIAAGHRRAGLTRQMGGELMGYSSYFMDCALREAETVTNQQINAWKDMLPTAQAVATLRAETYQDALKEAIKTCYKSPMNQAFRWLTAESRPYGLPKPQIETITSQDFMTLVMVIPLRCFDIEDYCPDGDDSGNNPKIEQPYDNIVSINLLIISFEWNTDTNELEFNVGQGVILGATWSPETGFGLQLGVGVDIGFGGVGIEAATYVTVDEGVTGLRTELGGSFGVGPIGFGAEIVPFQAVLQER